MYCTRKDEALAVRVGLLFGSAAAQKKFVAACIEGDAAVVASLLEKLPPDGELQQISRRYYIHPKENSLTTHV